MLGRDVRMSCNLNSERRWREDSYERHAHLVVNQHDFISPSGHVLRARQPLDVLAIQRAP